MGAGKEPPKAGSTTANPSSCNASGIVAWQTSARTMPIVSASVSSADDKCLASLQERTHEAVFRWRACHRQK
jgi:hypothetical protein